MSARTDQIAALKQFKNAYVNLINMWVREGYSLNDLNAVGQYPFHRSLDELPVIDWVNNSIRELNHMTDYVNRSTAISHNDALNLLKILREKRDDIGCVSTSVVDGLYERLKYVEYNATIIDFYKMLDKALPDLPSETPEEQTAYDEAWDKFYRTPFTISFGDKSVKIENDAIIYNGILDTLKEVVENL